MTAPRTFTPNDPIIHTEGWLGHVLSRDERGFVRVCWSDGHRPTSERAADLDFHHDEKETARGAC